MCINPAAKGGGAEDEQTPGARSKPGSVRDWVSRNKVGNDQ